MKRIQAEISEVERRERELREKKLLLTSLSNGFLTANDNVNGTISPPPSSDGSPSSMTSTSTDKDHNIDSVSSTMSDDSGISSSSSPINGQSNNRKPIPKYIRSFTVQNNIMSSGNVGPQSPPIMPLKLTRTMSTPQIYVPGTRFNATPATKGIMQRFIATRGRLPSGGLGNGVGAGMGGINGNANGLNKNDDDSFTNGKSNILVRNFSK